MIELSVETYDYSVDASDLIESVSDAWLTFARVNGAPELTRESVIGRSLWDFIDGSDTQHFYRALFERIRLDPVDTTIPFRCDSPELRRYMELSFRSGTEGRLVLSGRLLREETQAHVPLIDELFAGLRQKFSICSLCRRVRGYDEWLEPEVALKRLHIFETAQRPEVDHVVCDQCRLLKGSITAVNH